MASSRASASRVAEGTLRDPEKAGQLGEELAAGTQLSADFPVRADGADGVGVGPGEARHQPSGWRRARSPRRAAAARSARERRGTRRPHARARGRRSGRRCPPRAPIERTNAPMRSESSRASRRSISGLAVGQLVVDRRPAVVAAAARRCPGSRPGGAGRTGAPRARRRRRRPSGRGSSRRTAPSRAPRRCSRASSGASKIRATLAEARRGRQASPVLAGRLDDECLLARGRARRRSGRAATSSVGCSSNGFIRHQRNPMAREEVVRRQVAVPGKALAGGAASSSSP